MFTDPDTAVAAPAATVAGKAGRATAAIQPGKQRSRWIGLTIEKPNAKSGLASSGGGGTCTLAEPN